MSGDLHIVLVRLKVSHEQRAEINLSVLLKWSNLAIHYNQIIFSIAPQRCQVKSEVTHQYQIQKTRQKRV